MVRKRKTPSASQISQTLAHEVTGGEPPDGGKENRLRHGWKEKRNIELPGTKVILRRKEMKNSTMPQLRLPVTVWGKIGPAISNGEEGKKTKRPLGRWHTTREKKGRGRGNRCSRLEMTSVRRSQVQGKARTSPRGSCSDSNPPQHKPP